MGRLKSWRLQSASTRSGSEARSYHPCQPFSRCGSRRGSTTNRVQRSYTASVSDYASLDTFAHKIREACRMDHSNVHTYDAGTCYPCFLFLTSASAQDFPSRCMQAEKK